MVNSGEKKDSELQKKVGKVFFQEKHELCNCLQCSCEKLTIEKFEKLQFFLKWRRSKKLF